MCEGGDDSYHRVTLLSLLCFLFFRPIEKEQKGKFIGEEGSNRKKQYVFRKSVADNFTSEPQKSPLELAFQ